jgi:hypothetical protein
MQEAENPRIVVLFRPVDIPALDRMAEHFELSRAMRSSWFFVHSTDFEAELPPEPDVAPEDVARGMELCRYLSRRLFLVLSPLREQIPEIDEARGFELGWHPSATLEELRAAFAASDMETQDLWTLTRSHSHPEVCAHDRLRVLREVKLEEQDEQALEALSYLLDGEGTGRAPALGVEGAAVLAMLFWICGDLSLPAGPRQRLEGLLAEDVSAWRAAVGLAAHDAAEVDESA